MKLKRSKYFQGVEAPPSKESVTTHKRTRRARSSGSGIVSGVGFGFVLFEYMSVRDTVPN